MKTILILMIGLFSCSNSKSTTENETKIYYFEDIKNEFSMSPKKSIIEFRHDTIYVIDFPLDPAGMLNYSYGTYKTNNKSNTIIYQIEKDITFSMNIGQVVWYTEKCNNSCQLEIKENGKLIRERRKDTFQINDNGDLISNENVKMNYNQIESQKINTQYNWVHMLGNYQDVEKRKNCK